MPQTVYRVDPNHSNLRLAVGFSLVIGFMAGYFGVRLLFGTLGVGGSPLLLGLLVGALFAVGFSLAAERALPFRAPVILCVVSSPVHDPKKTPVWEQQLSAGALCQNILIASQAMGWAGVWITEDAAYDGHVQAALGLSGHEQIAGYIYLGTARDQPVERLRPDVSAKATRWTG